MYELSLNENDMNFKDLEQNIFKFVCQQACEMLLEIFEKLDDKLMKDRDKKTHKNKGFKRTTIKTVMGEIEYERRIYEYKTEDDKKAYRYLLDEYLKMNTIGHISTNLVEEIDGVWISMQGKDRESKNRGKKEIKLGIFYEGWEKVHQKTDRYEVINKKAYSCFKGSKEFKEIREAKISKEYNINEIETKILNGDGAGWIKEIARDDNSYFQLDPFHRNQAVYKNIEDRSKAKEIVNKLSIGKIDESLKIIINLMIENNEDKDKMDK